jgi:membrane-associated phospholipid phosphatase
MHQEFKDSKPWLPVAGYVMACATGYLRMYNNKHWISDVLAGAGIGIGSTRLAYLIYEKYRKRHTGRTHPAAVAGL